MTFLQGKRTYILGFAAVLWGLFGALDGLTTWGAALPIIWSGLAALGIRSAIANQ